MLDFMRRHAQSWMIKVALGAIVVVFVFWGIWNPRESKERDLARIADQTITIAEARSYYQNLRERYQYIYREKFNEEMAKKFNLKEQTLKDLINKTLLLHEAHRLGLTVSEEELQASIQNYPAFQKNGIFDKATYLRAIQSIRMTAGEFEASQRQMLLISKVQNLIVSSAKASDREVLDSYRAKFEQVNLDVLSLHPGDIKGVSFNPDELKGYFSKHREEFKIPAKVKVRYLFFDPKNYFKQVQITSKEIEIYYQHNQEKFGQPKRVKVSHILIKSNPKDPEDVKAKARKTADSVREEAGKGKDFSRLAKTYSQDPGTKDQGGELGYITRGQVVPEFEQAAFSLQVGGISKVIETPYGLHILKVTDVEESKIEPLEKVRSQIESTLRTRNAQELAQDEADQVYAAGSKGKSLEDLAKEKSLNMMETGFFSAGDKVGLDPKLQEAALTLSKGEVNPVFRLGEIFAVLQVVAKQEPRIPELKEVEEQVSAALTREKQNEIALAKAKEVLEKLKKGADLKSPASQEGFKTDVTGFFARGTEPPNMTPSEEVHTAITALSPKNPYPENPVFQEGKYFIFHFKEMKEIDQTQFNSQKDNFRLTLIQQKQERILNHWLEDVLEQAKAKGKYKMFHDINEVI